MSQVTVVVPCYNEAQRFSPAGFEPLLADPGLKLLLVDDGSTDATRACLDAFAGAHIGRVRVLGLQKNSGKAEAVRRGLLAGLEDDAAIVGYLDADLATPALELLRMLGEMRATGAEAVLGARVRLLGREVERHSVRHYLGRVFATAASIALGLDVYDTQCGAKLFSAGPALRSALETPFLSRWAFDVEFLQRLLIAPEAPVQRAKILEVPLLVWRDVAGSKLTPAAMVKAGLDLVSVFARRSRTEREARMRAETDH